MANGFVHNPQGYLSVLNGSGAYGACDRAGSTIAMQAGSGYTHDTQRGQTRIHTRVKTFGRAAYYGERKTHRLARIADTARNARW